MEHGSKEASPGYVYLSYRRDGMGIECARQIRTALRRFGIQAFGDIENLPPNVPFEHREGIARCSFFVMLVTAGYCEGLEDRSHVLHKEVRYFDP
jgi:hypothetical protein